MCGRLAQTTPPEVIASLFDLSGAAPLGPRYNVAPTSPLLIVREDPASGARVLRVVRWGLIPRWAEELPAGPPTFNARAETVHARPMFRDAFRHRRCVVPIAGFYEWRRSAARKAQPYFIRRADAAPLILGGIWEEWQSPDGELIESAAILTTAPNALMAELHDRMPLALERGDVPLWLDRAVTSREPLEPLLQPREWPGVVKHAVSTRVNKAGVEGPLCIEPVQDDGAGGLLGAW